jgi:predicted ATPase
MIERVIIRRFKRFAEVTFDLPGHIVLAGPNNTGKSTVLQAIAAWDLALNRWKQLNDFQRHFGNYTRAPVTRQTFSAVPLRTFDLLWKDRTYSASAPIEIEIRSRNGWTVTMEFIADSTEQIYVRPKPDVHPSTVKNAEINAAFVPPMTGLSTDEPVYQRPKVDQLLGQSKPGDVLRNLLVEAHQKTTAWDPLTASISRLFGYQILPPDSTGAHIVAEYRASSSGSRLDIASAGSGFQQVLMLLTFLHIRPGSVLLLDEPDAHLHVILQDAIFGELRAVSVKQRSQLIIATHSEVIINSIEPTELCIMLDQPRMVASTEERNILIRSLAVLSNEDIMKAMQAPGVLYLEDHTDLQILREWALVLQHPAHELLTTRLFWKKTVSQPRPGSDGIPAKKHYEALQLVRSNLPGLELIDGDAHPDIQATEITGKGLQRLRWKRYEIESYLLHPEALARYVKQMVGSDTADLHVSDLQKHFEENYPPAFLRDPFGDYPYLVGTKARTQLLPPALTAAGLSGLPYTRYYEIAAVMKPEEIHHEVVEKLNAIQRSFGL